MALLEGHRPADHFPFAVGVGEAIPDPKLFGKDGHRLRGRGAALLRSVHGRQGYRKVNGRLLASGRRDYPPSKPRFLLASFVVRLQASYWCSYWSGKPGFEVQRCDLSEDVCDRR